MSYRFNLMLSTLTEHRLHPAVRALTLHDEITVQRDDLGKAPDGEDLFLATLEVVAMAESLARRLITGIIGDALNGLRYTIELTLRSDSTGPD